MEVHMKMLEMWRYFLLFNTVLTGLSSALYTDSNENTELIQQRAGYDVKLECNLKGLLGERHHSPDVEIHWYFKQCSDSFDDNPGGVGGSNTVRCDDYYNNDWTKLPEQSFNQPTILLRNVTENYSGLYKCTLRPHQREEATPGEQQLLNIHIVRMFRLDVKRDVSEDAPQFLDIQPVDQTASLTSQVVFQCRVHNADYPSIMWFRRVSPVAAEQIQPRGDYVRHGEFYYERLATAREKLIDKDVYLSKLMLANIRQQDEGFYACVAISYRGYRVREAYLTVRLTNDPDESSHSPDYWADYSDIDELRKSPQEFWVLFLMPLGLVLLPLCLLCGWCMLRKYRQHDEILETAVGSAKCCDNVEVGVIEPLRMRNER